MWAPQYPLAPEAGWQDSFEPLARLIEALELRIVIGDSAGGGLALGLAHAFAAHGVGLEVAAIAPWADLTGSHPDFDRYHARDPWLTVDRMRVSAAAWAGDTALTSPFVSPQFGSFRGIARLLVIAGTADSLYPDAREVAARAAQADVPTELIVGRGLPHVYPLLPIPEAKPALDALMGWVRASPAYGTL